MKRSLSMGVTLFIALSLVTTSSGLSAAPKPKAVIEDPASDANFINDQGTGDGSFGDFVTPADISSVTDILEVQMSNDAKNLYITFDTETAPPATQGVGFRLRVNPDGAGGSYCLLFEAFYPGAGNALDQDLAHLRDTCTGETTEIEVLGPTLSIPRKINKAFAKGATLKAPQAQGFIYLGGPPPAGAPYPVLDTTKTGKDYKFVK